jgi:hypothetical protein
MPSDPQSGLEKEFVQAALARSRWLRQGEAIKSGRESEKMRVIIGKLRALPDRGEQVFKRIAGSEDAELRILAASGLLALDEAFAANVLRKIIEGRDQSKAFDAEMTLKEWQSGLNRDFWG